MRQYQYNKTMRHLNQQNYDRKITDKDYRQLKNVWNAHKAYRPIDIVMVLSDAFVLGHIAGTRAERAKRKVK